MQIRWKYFFGVNGALLLFLGLHIVVDDAWTRRDMFRLEVRNLKDTARAISQAGFDGQTPRPLLPELVQTLARVHEGMEAMVLDASMRVVASWPPRRVGEQWEEDGIQRVLNQRRPAATHMDEHYHDGVQVIDFTMPVAAGTGRPHHAIHVARRLSLVEELVRRHRAYRLAWAAGAVLLVGLAINLVTFLWLLRPVKRITATLASSRWRQPPGRGGGDELSHLEQSVVRLVADAEAALADKEALLGKVREFNQQLEREVDKARQELARTQERLVQQERLSAVGEVAAGLAHELRNPLHIVRGDAELLARRPENQEACQDILEEVDRINRFVNNLLDYTRALEPGDEMEPLEPVVRSAAVSMARLHEGDEVSIQVDCPADLTARVDSDHLSQILNNLVENAIQASSPGGTVWVRITPGEGEMTLEVKDEGRGVASEDLPHLMQPFFTRRQAGTGLGLTIVKRLVDLYDGQVSVESRPGEGTSMKVTLRCGGG